MRDKLPDEISLEWFLKNKGRVRAALNEAEKPVVVVGPEGQIAPGKTNRNSVNILHDLRIIETSADPLPIAPPVLSLTVDDPDQELDLDWTLPESYNELFLERSDDGGETWTPLIALPGTQDAYEDADVTPGTEYPYRIRGRVGGAYSAYSNIVSGELAVSAGYALAGTGENANYQLGDGTTTSPDEFTASALADVVSIAGGLTHSLAITADGKLYACGFNQYGQCGGGTSGNNVTTWTQIGTDEDWAYVRAGSHFSVAVKTNSDVYVFGRNNLGQLGLGDNTNRTSPTQVGAGSTWIFVNAGEFNLLLVKNDNTLWMAGWGTQNQIGDGGASNRNALTQTTGSGYVRAYAGRDFAFGIKTGGTLWAWGYNGDGQLGLGSATSNFSTPTQVGVSTDNKSVSAGEGFAVLTKTGGTIYVSGSEISTGQLGLGATTDTGTVFVQIGSDTNWDYTTSGPSSTLALKTTGAVYGWGYNGDGGLGVGDTSTRTTPTQEATSATTFTAVANASGYHGLALQTA